MAVLAYVCLARFDTRIRHDENLLDWDDPTLE
jgi:hypothetical protein